jgi:predicted acylesterase/phospholipase RssA
MPVPVATPGAPSEKRLQEVRVAMALNGGVSLAVWMGGCAVELDRARRADEPGNEARRVYDALCECLERRLVIDILAGASAGGINGALLSAAMVSRRKLDVDFVRERWLDLGDLSELLYPIEKEDPRALMSGDLFHDRLLETFEEVLGANPHPPNKDQCRQLGQAPRRVVPSLDVTMTDVVGVEKSFTDVWGGKLIAREHRPRFKFREGIHFDAKRLAHAARTSASFPIAFEPWRVHDEAQALAGLPGETYGIDGGLLDNAPIEAALELIPSKPADSRVRRYVCYLNGDPPAAGEERPVTAPNLREVGGYVVNLPRAAPFVDQLYAIKRAVERSSHARSVQIELLTMDLPSLLPVAKALFDTYAERRAIQSLEEILEDPGEATAEMETLRTMGVLPPWIPFALVPPREGTWSWGIRPAQRILHLLLDLVRPLIADAPDEIRKELLTARDQIDKRLISLGEAHEEITKDQSESVPGRVTRKSSRERLRRATTTGALNARSAYEAVTASAQAVRSVVVERHGTHFAGDPVVGGLFGAQDEAGWLPDFFLRALSIEVIRRAFSTEADVESAEKLRFVQLTPMAPTPILTSGPLSLKSPATTAEKLTGVGLGHFAGFFRRSWRANDFMWGRLDAAARIVDLLLDKPVDDDLSPAEQAAWAETRGTCLADALLPTEVADDDPRLWLARETLADAEATAGLAAPPTDADGVRYLVREGIEAELAMASADTGVDAMPFTRAMFQRAAQLEVVERELSELRKESIADRELGSSAKPLTLDGDRPQAQIEGVRQVYENGETLPKRLIDEDEAVSDLGLRTIAHAAFVGLSAVRTAGAPLSKFFGVVRVPLSAVAATVSKGPWPRAIAGLGFWAAATYLTSRLLSTAPEQTPRFAEVWTWAMLTAFVSALGIAGMVAVPVLRLWRGVHPVRNLLTTLALAGSAFVFAAVLAATFGSFDIERIVFAPGATNPPKGVVLAPLVALGLLSASRLPIPRWLNLSIEKLRAVRASWVLTLLLPGVAFALVLISTVGPLWDKGFDGGAAWQAAAAAFALFATPLAAAISLARRRA